MPRGTRHEGLVEKVQICRLVPLEQVLVRAITKDGSVKAVAVVTKDLTERVRNIHKTLPVEPI